MSRLSRSAVWEPRSGSGGHASRALEERSYVSHTRSAGPPRNSTPAARLNGRASYGQAALLPAGMWASSFGPVGEERALQEISTR